MAYLSHIEQGKFRGLGTGTIPGLTLSLSYTWDSGMTEWGGGAGPFSFKYHEIPCLLHAISMCWNIFPGKLYTEMSTRISFTLETRKLIFFFRHMNG